MYSKIPIPGFKWKEGDYSHSLAFFPLVGVLIGALAFAINCLSPFDHLHVAVRIILTMLVPLVITGGFHLDGFMDTEDALNSYGTTEKKLQILKDSHIGAFAVISLMKWMMIYAAAVTAILLNDKYSAEVVLVLGTTFVISRCLSGITSMFFTKARKEGMLYQETQSDQKAVVALLIVQLLAACLLAFYVNPLYGVSVIVTFSLYTVYYRYKAYKEFGGVTGDTAGFFLTTGEILAAVAIAIVIYV